MQLNPNTRNRRINPTGISTHNLGILSVEDNERMKITEISILFKHETENSDEAAIALEESKFHKELINRGLELTEVDYDDENLWRAVYQ